MNIVVIFNNLGPYHFARLNGAAAYADVTGVELFGKSREYAWTNDGVPSQHRFRHLTLFNAAEAVIPKAELKDKLFALLNDLKPDAVAVNGWSEPGAFFALKWCGMAKVPAIVMSESTAYDAPRQGWKEEIKKQIISRFSAALVGGKPHVAYMQQLGMPSERIFTGYDVVDNEYFSDAARAVRSEADDWRQRLKLPKQYFVASARFVPKKNLEKLLQAFAAYRVSAGNGAWELVLLGDGEGRAALEKLAADLNITEHLHLPGFCQYDVIPAYYALASAFVHVSTVEQWGLVVNETMAAGLPVLVSNRCGCAPDLVEDGVNGWTLDPFSVTDIANKMLRLSTTPNLEAMGIASQKIVSGFGPALFGKHLAAAAQAASRQHRSRSRLLSGLTLNFLINK